MTTTPVTVTITGAAGQIGYATVFRIASGHLLGPHTPVRLRLLEVPQAVRAAEAVAMELEDCAFELLAGVDVVDTPAAGFAGANIAILIGARPRGKGMERSDLLTANGAIFSAQGAAINAHAAADIRVLVVGNPANTNAYIASAHAPDVPVERFTAMMRLDHNRAVAMLAGRAGVPVTDVKQVTVWGNHSTTQYPDVDHARIGTRAAREVIGDDTWVNGEFIDAVAKRGAVIIEARGASSAASAGNAAIGQVREWVAGSPADSWASVSLASQGSYGIPEGLFCSVPARSRDGAWQVVEGLDISAFSRSRIDASVAELAEEAGAVRALGLV